MALKNIFVLSLLLSSTAIGNCQPLSKLNIVNNAIKLLNSFVLLFSTDDNGLLQELKEMIQTLSNEVKSNREKLEDNGEKLDQLINHLECKSIFNFRL